MAKYEGGANLRGKKSFAKMVGQGFAFVVLAAVAWCVLGGLAGLAWRVAAWVIP